MRRTPLRADPEAVRGWQERSRQLGALARAARGPQRRARLARRAPAPDERPKRPLARKGSLRRGQRRRRASIPPAMRHRVFARTRWRCCCGCGRAARQLHHVLPVQRWPELELAEDNLVGVANRCHERHELAVRRLPRAALPARTLDLARRVGPAAELYLEKTYAAEGGPTPGGTRRDEKGGAA